MKTTDNLNNSWRKVAAAIYKKPTDSKIFGSVEMDVTDLEEYITKKRKTGLKITLTHIFVLAVARALRNDVPELNAYVRRGKIIGRKHIDAMVSVLHRDEQMGSIKVPDADMLTLYELVEVMNESIIKARSGNENKTMDMKGKLAYWPWPFRTMFFRIFKKFTIDWGLTIPFVGLKAGDFGSFVLSNIGSLGLDIGFPALLPVSDVAMVFILGGVSKKPVVINDKIVPRKILSLGVTLDHRLVDASHGGKLFRYLKFIVKNPQELEKNPDPLT